MEHQGPRPLANPLSAPIQPSVKRNKCRRRTSPLGLKNAFLFDNTKKCFKKCFQKTSFKKGGFCIYPFCQKAFSDINSQKWVWLLMHPASIWIGIRIRCMKDGPQKNEQSLTFGVQKERNKDTKETKHQHPPTKTNKNEKKNGNKPSMSTKTCIFFSSRLKDFMIPEGYSKVCKDRMAGAKQSSHMNNISPPANSQNNSPMNPRLAGVSRLWFKTFWWTCLSCLSQKIPNDCSITKRSYLSHLHTIAIQNLKHSNEKPPAPSNIKKKLKTNLKRQKGAGHPKTSNDQTSSSPGLLHQWNRRGPPTHHRPWQVAPEPSTNPRGSRPLDVALIRWLFGLEEKTRALCISRLFWSVV